MTRQFHKMWDEEELQRMIEEAMKVKE